MLFCSCNFTAFSQATVSFETITEALNYAGDRDAVKKLIVTGTISGNDYSPTSSATKKHKKKIYLQLFQRYIVIFAF